MMLVNGESVLMERMAGLGLVPVEDLDFEVADQQDGFTVTISSARWSIEGCGKGSSNGEITIHSIGGVRDRDGGALVIRESGSRADHRIFVEDSRGQRRLIP